MKKTSQEIKEDMKRLWKDIFHDSDSYISIILDNYFDERFVETEYADGRLIAMLVGIPYRFNTIAGLRHGLYLCGLATVPECRGRGIMGKLISRSHETARNLGFDFTFLIPAESRLRKYYARKGYVDSFYRLKCELKAKENDENKCQEIRTGISADFDEIYLSEITHDNYIYLTEEIKCSKQFKDLSNIYINKSTNFSLESNSFYEEEKSSSYEEGIEDSKSQRYKTSLEKVNEIQLYIKNYEQYKVMNNILHTRKDIQQIIYESKISSSKIIVYKNFQNKICGLAFVQLHNSEDKITIQSMKFINEEMKYKFLVWAKKYFHVSQVEWYDEISRNCNYDYVKSSTDKKLNKGEGQRIENVLESFGMIHYLARNENSIFPTTESGVLKYPILASWDNEGKNSVIFQVSEAVYKSVAIDDRITELGAAAQSISEATSQKRDLRDINLWIDLLLE